MNSRDEKQNKSTFLKMPRADYRFINWNNMPSGTYISDSLNYKEINWVKTRDLSYGINHCAAAAATNITLYYASLGYSNLIKDNSTYHTFVEIHKRIKNGPVISIASKIRQYFNKNGYELHYSKLGSFDNLKKAIGKKRPCALILSSALINWHWILAVGWRVYDSGEKYIQIVDGWNGNATRFYKIDSNLPFVLSTQYWT